MADTRKILDLAGVAEHLGIAYSTARDYYASGRLPEPDMRLGRKPGWKATTIDRWNARRPGQGWRAGQRTTR